MSLESDGNLKEPDSNVKAKKTSADDFKTYIQLETGGKFISVLIGELLYCSCQCHHLLHAVYVLKYLCIFGGVSDVIMSELDTSEAEDDVDWKE